MLMGVFVLQAFLFFCKPSRRGCLLFILMVSFGVCSILDDIANNPDDVNRFSGSQQNVILGGTVSDLPRVSPLSIRFRIDAESIRHGDSVFPVSGGVLVSLKRNQDNLALIDSLTYGRRVQLQGILQDVGRMRNPGDFDIRTYSILNGISARLWVENKTDLLLRQHSAGSFVHTAIHRVRKSLLTRIDSLIGGEEAMLLKGLLVGERSDISEDTKNAFINSGLMHILAVSGLHVAIVAVMMLMVMMVLRVPEKTRTILTMVFLVYYMFLTGGTASVARSVIMAIVLLGARLLELRSDLYNTVAVSALIILLYDARQLLQPGFQLSYVAVLAIVYLYPRLMDVLRCIPKKLSEHWAGRIVSASLAVSIAAGFGTLPFSAFYFGKISLIGFAANLIAVPLSNVVLAIGMVTLIFSYVSGWLASIFAEPTLLLTQWLIQSVGFFGTAPLAYIEARITPLGSIAFYSALLLIANLGNRSIRPRLVLALLVMMNCCLYVMAFSGSHKRELRVTFLDVGQGDAMLIEFPGGDNLLVDAGPLTSASDAGVRFILPFLRWRGLSEIDAVLSSHPHSDHIGGIPSILRNRRVTSVIDAGPNGTSRLFSQYLRLADSLQVTRHVAAAGDRIDICEDVRLYVLHPDSAGRSAGLNNQSIVVKLVFGKTSLLLTGDVEVEGEHELTRRYGSFLKCDIIKVGHHGSITSSSESFLELVRPSTAVISVGERNKFRHPSPEVISRFVRRSCDVLRTDREGAIVFVSDGEAWQRIPWR